MKKRLAFLLTSVLSGFIIIFTSFGDAEALVMKYKFSGIVTSEDIDGYGDMLNVGDTFYGTFSYDTDYKYPIWDGSAYAYEEGTTSGYIVFPRSGVYFDGEPQLIYGTLDDIPFRVNFYVWYWMTIYGPGAIPTEFWISDVFEDWGKNVMYFGTVNFTPIPEPATMLLLGSGLIAIAVLGRKKFFKK